MRTAIRRPSRLPLEGRVGSLVLTSPVFSLSAIDE
jgi:hypothetical protein